MWGGNGKSHSWSMGYHWLVGLLVFSSEIVSAEFMSNDSQNLQKIWYALDGSSDGNSIWALTLRQNSILNGIDAKLQPISSHVSTISSDVSSIKQYLDYNLNGDTATDSMSVHDFIQEFNRKFFYGVDRYDRTVAANPATVSIFSPNGISPFIEPGKTFQKRYTSQIAVTNIAATALLEKISLSLEPLSNITNTFIAGLDLGNFYTNGASLSQYSTNIIASVSDSVGINTNEMFLGFYGSETNSDVFADIMTNGVELLEGNQVYSSLGDDVDASSLSNKVSMFNFTEKFDDSIKPFLDEIENASGGDWVIRIGNVDLGDYFSFTIPDLTIERNETFLGYVDHFLNVLKIIFGVVFFLTLWHQLENAVEGT